MACGLGDSISYENLISQLLKASIDKSSQFTDWQRRPLTDKQLKYAQGDVTHLRHAYVKLKADLEAKDRMAWIEQETEVLVNPDTYDTNPKNAWKRMKLRKPRKDYLALIVTVSEWRERIAQDSDKPRSRILKDDAIQEIAQQKPKDIAALDRLRAVPKGFGKSKYGQSLLQAIHDGLNDPDAYAPEFEKRKPSQQAPGAVGDLMKVLLKHVADEAGVAPRLIANASDIEKISTEDDPDVPAMSGWRREVFGELAIKLKTGKIALAATPKGVKVFDV
jgi:ribonuclease D